MTKWILCELMQVALGLGQRFEFSGLSLLKWVAPDKCLPLGGLCSCPGRDKMDRLQFRGREGGRQEAGESGPAGTGGDPALGEDSGQRPSLEAKGQKWECAAPPPWAEWGRGEMGLGEKAGQRRGSLSTAQRGQHS